MKKDEESQQRIRKSKQQLDTSKAELPPPLSRMILVAAGGEKWTENESRWLAEHPKFKLFEADLGAAIKQLGITELLTRKQLISFSKVWTETPYEHRLAEIVDSILSGEDKPDTKHANRIRRNQGINPRSKL